MYIHITNGYGLVIPLCWYIRILDALTLGSGHLCLKSISTCGISISIARVDSQLKVLLINFRFSVTRKNDARFSSVTELKEGFLSDHVTSSYKMEKEYRDDSVGSA